MDGYAPVVYLDLRGIEVRVGPLWEHAKMD